MRLVTIGVYGFDEASFFETLQRAGVDTFCDIRWRRGVRGKEFAFANSGRLQRRLAQMGIRYLHFRELAPPPEVRQRQDDEDKAQGITKRKRSVLGERFIEGYEEKCLSDFDSERFIAQLGVETKTAALFCVEREPTACHRSLLARRLGEDLGSKIEIAHLLPGGAFESFDRS